MAKGLLIRIRVDESEEAIFRAAANAMGTTVSNMARCAMGEVAAKTATGLGLNFSQLVEKHGSGFGSHLPENYGKKETLPFPKDGS